MNKFTSNEQKAKYKREEREKKYGKGWKNFSITCPDECADFLRQQYNIFKQANLHLWR